MCDNAEINSRYDVLLYRGLEYFGCFEEFKRRICFIKYITRKWENNILLQFDIVHRDSKLEAGEIK